MGNNGRDSGSTATTSCSWFPQDRNLGRIRDDIATMEAADRLLKDQNQKLQDHRRSTLEGIRAESEKNAMSGIHTKWSHLICPGISEPHRWPEQEVFWNTARYRPQPSQRGTVRSRFWTKWATESCMDRGRHQPGRMGADSHP